MLQQIHNISTACIFHLWKASTAVVPVCIIFDSSIKFRIGKRSAFRSKKPGLNECKTMSSAVTTGKGSYIQNADIFIPTSLYSVYCNQ